MNFNYLYLKYLKLFPGDGLLGNSGLPRFGNIDGITFYCMPLA